MTMKIVRSKEEFIDVASKEIFDDMRNTIHDLDDQATSAGLDDPDILLRMSANIAMYAASYAAYLMAGLYMSADKSDLVVAEGVATLEEDIQNAMAGGVKLAIRNVEAATKVTAQAQADTDALLKKVVKTFKNTRNSPPKSLTLQIRLVRSELVCSPSRGQARR